MNAAEIAAQTGGTVTERAIAILIAAGVTSSKAIAEALGITPRAVQMAKKATKERSTVRQDSEARFAKAKHTSPPCEAHFASDAKSASLSAAPSRARIESTLRVDTLPLKKDSLATSADADVPARKRAKPPSLDTRLPADWVLPPAWKAWALENLSPDEAAVAAEADKFRDYWLAAPGSKGRKRDWAATWRNWCRNAKPPPRRPSGVASAEDDIPPWRRDLLRRDAECRAALEKLN